MPWAPLKMKFCVPANFEKGLIPRLPEGDVHSLYGKLSVDCVGGGRSSYLLPRITKEDVAQCVKKAHEKGILFNYLLNSVCIGNRELNTGWQKEFRKLLDWLTQIKVDSVTVAIPLLARLICKDYPHFKIIASSLAHIKTIEEAQYWEGLGVDAIILHSVFINRDFRGLGRIRKYVRCSLELIANNACLDRCPMSTYHHHVPGHASQTDDHKNGPAVNYFLLQCRSQRLKDPVNFIRSDWIRPEDIRHYEDAGIEYLKIVDRNQSTRFLVNAVKAYAQRRYDGNLADLFPFGASAPFLKVRIDNRALDGFLDHFIKGRCQKGACDTCGYCASVTKKAVKVNKQQRACAFKNYEEVLSEIF